MLGGKKKKKAKQLAAEQEKMKKIMKEAGVDMGKDAAKIAKPDTKKGKGAPLLALIACSSCGSVHSYAYPARAQPLPRPRLQPRKVATRWLPWTRAKMARAPARWEI